MTDELTQHDELPSEALVKPVKTLSKIWLIPIVTLLIGIWIIYYQWSNQGPLISIEFKTATGIEAGKTKIKIHDVDVGLVKKIELTKNLKGVLVTARLDKNVDSLLHADNQFWIVSPRVSLNGVSGLGTILSGPYINMATGVATEMSNQFVALDGPPVTPPGTPGLHVTLNSNTEFAYKEGDPVIYKGIKVGEFEDIYFNFDERVVYYNTFIEAPYHKLITQNTKFWDISGVQMDLSASGVKVSTGSLETLLTNGVTFGIPEGMPSGQQITERTYFDIHTSYELAAEERFKLSAEYVILVKDTVRGLNVGAPVEYRGLVIGKVLAINPEINNQSGLLEEGYDIPVIIGIQPGRVQQPDNRLGLEFVRKQTNIWIERGLRATLKTGNLLTGALFVDLQHYSNLPPMQVRSLFEYEVIPTITDEFSQITAKVSAVLDNVNQIKMQKISESADEMLTQIAKTAESLQKTSTNIDLVLSSIQEQKVSHTLTSTLQSLSKLSKDFSEGSTNYQELNVTMSTLQQTLRELRPLLQELNNKPNGLIFNNGDERKFIPKAQGLIEKGVSN